MRGLAESMGGEDGLDRRLLGSIIFINSILPPFLALSFSVVLYPQNVLWYSLRNNDR